MKINKIQYSKSYEMVLGGKSVWERIGLEADLDDYESPEKGLGVLKDMVEDFHKKSNPEPEFVPDTFTPIIPKKNGARIEPNMEIRKKYAEAAAIQDHDTIHKLETIYNFQIC